MPTYQYACTQCDHDFDAIQAFTDNSLTECPECQGRLRKVFGAVGIVFKGSGFYRTDSRDTKSTSDPAPKTDAGTSGSNTDSSTKSGDSTSSTTPAKGSDTGSSSTPAKNGAKPAKTTTTSPSASKPSAGSAA